MCGELAWMAEKLIADLAARGNLRGATRDQAMRLYMESQLLRLTGERSLAASWARRARLRTIIKLAWWSIGQALQVFAVDAVGIGAVAGVDGLPYADGLTMSPSYGIAGGTTEVLKNLIGERVLGLAKEPGPT